MSGEARPGSGDTDPFVDLPSPEEVDAGTAFAADPSLSVDETGIVRGCSPSAEVLLGSPGRTLVGRSVATVLATPEAHPPVSPLPALGGEADGGGRGSLVTLVRPDGREQAIALTSRLVHTTSGCRTVLALRDGTDVQRVNAELAGRDRILTAVADAVDRLLRSDRLEEAVDDVLRTLGEATQVSRVYVFEVTDAGDDFLARQRWEWAAPGIEPQIDNEDLQAMPLRASGFSRWETVLEARGLIHGHVEELPEDEAELLRAQDIRSIVVAPLHVEGEWWGFLGFDECTVERIWSGPEVDALRAAADVLAVTMRHQTHRRSLEASERAYAEAYTREFEAAARLRQLDGMKDAFLEAVSHEIRTPLAGVIGFAETLERLEMVDADPRARPLLGRLRANAQRLDRIVTDLLDLSAMTRGSSSATRSRVALADLVADAVGDVTPQLGGRAVDVDLQVDEADVDPGGVMRILQNLLRNACRFGPAGATIDIRIWPQGNALEIAVGDRGPGVPDDLKERVFEPFRHGPNIDRHAPGTGVGLTVVAKYALLHGGRAWLEDRQGGGTVARVSLADAGVGS